MSYSRECVKCGTWFDGGIFDPCPHCEVKGNPSAPVTRATLLRLRTLALTEAEEQFLTDAKALLEGSGR